nr:flagellin [Paracoccus amoyensis]
MLDGSASLASEMAQVGYTQQLIEYAQTEGSAATATLEIVRNEIRQADPYATSTAITEAETHLDALYAVTARLSKLRLVDYLR